MSFNAENFDLAKVLPFALLHLFTCMVLFVPFRFMTFMLCMVLTGLGALGLTAGAHRLWAHHSYRATNKLKVFLMICHTLNGQGTIYDWVLDHRLHHKLFGTSDDKYDLKRGFLEIQVLQNLRTTSQKYNNLCSKVDMSDLENDPIVMFQKRYYWALMPILAIAIPLALPTLYWQETIVGSLDYMIFLRFFIVLHLKWLINSGILVWNHSQTEKQNYSSNLIFFVTRSYWPQYHYVAPWDYQNGEFGEYLTDTTSKFIRICAAVGLASDLVTADSDAVKYALYKSLDTGKPLDSCLEEQIKHNPLPNDHFLAPTKFI